MFLTLLSSLADEFSSNRSSLIALRSLRRARGLQSVHGISIAAINEILAHLMLNHSSALTPFGISNAAWMSPCWVKPEKEQPRGPTRLLLLLAEAGHWPRADLETGHDRTDMLGITDVNN